MEKNERDRKSALAKERERGGEREKERIFSIFSLCFFLLEKIIIRDGSNNIRK